VPIVRTQRALRSVAPLLASCVLWTLPAAAAPSGKDRQQAQALASEAKKLVNQGELKKALGKLKKADQLVPQLGTKLEIARLEHDLGDYVAGLATLRAITGAKASGFQDKRAQGEAQKKLDELAVKTPKVTVEIFKPEASKVTLTIDEEDVEAGEHELNPGRHELVAKAKGYEELRKTLRLDEGQRKTVEVSLRPLGEADASEGDSSSGGVPKWAAWTTWGLTAAAVGVGAGFGIMAIQTTNQVLADYGCENGKCPTTAAGDLDIAKFNGNVSTAAFAVGGAGLVTASILTALAYKKSDAKKDEPTEGETTVEARPLLGPGFVGVAGTF
jgi:hypothetical protein